MTTAAEKKTYRYEVRFPKKMTWTIFFITSDGIFMAVSDYKNFAHRWPVAGFPSDTTDFREFFLQFDDDYILRKLTNEEVVNVEATCKGLRERIIEERRDCGRDGGFQEHDREWARKEWELVDELESSEDDRAWYENTTLDDASEYIQYTRAPGWEQMATLFFPELRVLIKKELEAEKASALPPQG